MNLNDTFKLFANCIPVKGYSSSLICDLQNNNFVVIDNELFEILTLHNSKSVKDLSQVYKYEDVDNYLTFLSDANLGFFTSVPAFFPDINLSFNDCFLLSNGVIDYGGGFNLFDLIKQFDDLNCKNIEIRFYDNNIETLLAVLNYIESNEMMITSIGIVFESNDELNQEFLFGLIEKYNRVSYFIIFNSRENKLITSKKTNGMGYIIFTMDKINRNSCGIINSDYFITNIKAFTESISHNSCLNKKISIDKEGNIKNCPSMPQSFGNIEDTTLENALNHPEFKKYWNLTKDSIEVCKDCEFRYICTDCRAYTEQTSVNKEGLDTSKPLKCGYNPYTGEWEEWSTNPLKQKAIQAYGMQDFIQK